MKDILLKVKNRYVSFPSWVKRLIKYFLLYVLIFILFETIYQEGLSANDNRQSVKILMMLCLFADIAIGFYLLGKGKLNINSLTILLLIAGFVMRIGYAMYSGSNTRQHDVEMGSISDPNYNGSGHFSYIWIIYSTGKLPDSVDWQFYHPPLWHALAALQMHVYSWFHPSYTGVKLFMSCIILSSFIGCVTLVAIKDILFTIFYKDDDLSLKSSNNIMILITLSLLAFHSQFFIISGWTNNEGTALMFAILSLVYCLKFHKDRKWANAILSGLFLGMGVSAKISAALIAVPLAIIFFYDIYFDLVNAHSKIIFLQALLFIVIAAPIALWFPIRNTIKFGNPSISVPALDPYTSHMSVINYSYWERFGIPNIFKSYSESMYCILSKNENGYMDYNVWAYILKNSIYGEWGYWQGDMYGKVLYFFNVFLAPLSLIALIFILVKDIIKKDQYLLYTIAMNTLFFVNIISYIIFQINYPVACTQDFRYMVMTLIPGCYGLGRLFTSTKDNKLGLSLRIVLSMLIVGFELSSISYFIALV